MTTTFDIDELERLLAAADKLAANMAEIVKEWERDEPRDDWFLHQHDHADAVEMLNAQSTAIRELRAENARLKSEVVSFCGPWAAQYARETGLEPGHLHPTHYDILGKAGARMTNFTRAALGEPQ